MANAGDTAEVGLLNLMKHKMSRGTFNEGHEPSRRAEVDGDIASDLYRLSCLDI